MDLFPLNGTTTTLSATTSSPTPSAFTPTPGGTARVLNSGTVVAFVKSGIGSSDAVATTSSTPIQPGTVEAFFVPPNHTYVSAITGSGSATVYITVGDGE